MAIRHIYISHAANDATIATRLADHLKNAGHDTKVDTIDLSLGDNAIQFMNEGIANAHTIIILFSKHSADAKWQQLEIDSAVWNEVAQDGGRCIVLRLDDTSVPPILGRKVYGKLDIDDSTALRTVLENLCKVLLSSPTASSVIAEALRAESKNPFRHLRAEFFEDRPDLHAKAFAPPDALTSGALEEMKPCFLEGSRGTGKSMLLLSLRARNFLIRNKTIANAIPVFGFYLKLSRGAICNAGVISGNDWDPNTLRDRDAAQITDVAAQELIIQIVESLFSELAYAIERQLITGDRLHEKALAEAADQLLFDAQQNQCSSLDQLLDKLADSHKRVADFIRRRFIYDEQPSVPVTTFDLEQLKRVVKLIRRQTPALQNAMFIVLLDEYENLFPYQQRIVNGFVKLGPPALSIKIAKKLASNDTPATTTGQELQETHDYTRLPLVYDVEDTAQRKIYYDLLKHIVQNIFRTENLGPVDIDQLLPDDVQPEVSDESAKTEIAKLCKVTTAEFDGWSEDRRRDKWTYYKEAATYRVLLKPKGRHPEKRFVGFSQIAFLSSGVIRYFQEILGVAYHLTYASQAPANTGIVLPPEQQSKQCTSCHNITSQHWAEMLSDTAKNSNTSC